MYRLVLGLLPIKLRQPVRMFGKEQEQLSNHLHRLLAIRRQSVPGIDVAVKEFLQRSTGGGSLRGESRQPGRQRPHAIYIGYLLSGSLIESALNQPGNQSV